LSRAAAADVEYLVSRKGLAAAVQLIPLVDRVPELYIVLEGTGRIRTGEALHTLDRLSSVLVEPATVRQLFNDADRDQLWLVVGAPPEAANTLETTPDDLAFLYPNAPKALPPELERSQQADAT
jgi:hypothetical protein